MFAKFKQRRNAGKLYEGYAAYSDDYALVPRPGYYALDPSGKILLPDVPLVCVDDAGGDPWDGSCHYEYAGPKDNPQRQGYVVPPELRANPPADASPDIVQETTRRSGGGKIVLFEALAEGHAEVAS